MGVIVSMISLIIVDYKSIKKTIEYINQCFEMFEDNNKLNVIVVDNSLDNASLEYMKKINSTKICYKHEFETKGKKVKVFKYYYNRHNLIIVKADNNLGYAKGNNLGAMVSKKIFNDDYYIFSNNDVKILNKFKLEVFIDILKNDNKIAVIGPKIITPKGQFQSPIKKVGIWKKIILKYPSMLLGNILNRFIKDLDYDNKNKYAYWVNGSFLFVNGKKFNEVNMFDENTFLFAEEMILSERLLKAGYHNYFFNDLTILHEHGQTVKNKFSILQSLEMSFTSNYYYYENYMKSSQLNLSIAKISFKLFKVLYVIKENIKSRIKGVSE